jgi:hypothetical protein
MEAVPNAVRSWKIGDRERSALPANIKNLTGASEGRPRLFHLAVLAGGKERVE